MDDFSYFKDKVKEFYEHENSSIKLFSYLKALPEEENFSFKLLPDFLDLSFILDENDCEPGEILIIFNTSIIESLLEEIDTLSPASYKNLCNCLFIVKSLDNYTFSDFIEEIAHIPISERLELLNAVFDNFNSEEKCKNFVKELDNLGLLAIPSREE